MKLTYTQFIVEENDEEMDLAIANAVQDFEEDGIEIKDIKIGSCGVYLTALVIAKAEKETN